MRKLGLVWCFSLDETTFNFWREEQLKVHYRDFTVGFGLV